MECFLFIFSCLQTCQQSLKWIFNRIIIIKTVFSCRTGRKMTHLFFFFQSFLLLLSKFAFFFLFFNSLSKWFCKTVILMAYQMIENSLYLAISASARRTLASWRICCTSIGSGWRLLMYSSWFPWKKNYTVIKASFMNLTIQRARIRLFILSRST